MAELPIIIPPGVILDDTTFDAGSTAWSATDKVRFWRGSPQTLGGWERLVTTQLSGVCRAAFPWTDNGGQLNIAFGTHTHLQLWLGGELYDITPASGFTPGLIDGTGGAGFGTGAYGVGEYGIPSTTDYYPLTWSLADYGENLMACPRGQSLFQWTNITGSPATLISTAPANITYMLVANTRQVMAFGCNEETSGVFNPRAIRFSDIEDPTDWTTTSANFAGEFILEGSGQIVAARQIGNYLFVWTDNAVYLATYTGQQVQPWTFEQLGENCGLIGPNAAVVIAEQTAFWLGTNGQFFVCSLGGAPSILISPIQAALFDNITPAQADKIVASSCAQFAEIRFDYPDVRDGTENSRYVLYNSVDNCWAVGTMVRTAYVDAGPSPLPIGVDVTGDCYWHESGQSADGAPFDAYAETADMYLGEQIMQVQGMWPDVQNQVGNIVLTIKTQLYPQDTYYAWPPNPLTPNQSRADFQASGRIVRARYESNSSPTFWRLGKPVFDVVTTGKR